MSCGGSTPRRKANNYHPNPQPHLDIPMSARIYIGNLHFEVGDAILREAFERAGAVRSAEVIKDRWTGVSRGFGFVEMMTEAEAAAAIAALTGVEIMGRPARLAIAKPRPARIGRADSKAG